MDVSVSQISPGVCCVACVKWGFPALLNGGIAARAPCQRSSGVHCVQGRQSCAGICLFLGQLKLMKWKHLLGSATWFMLPCALGSENLIRTRGQCWSASHITSAQSEAGGCYCLFCSRIEDWVPEGGSQKPLQLYKSRKVFRHNLIHETNENLVGLINGKIMGKWVLPRSVYHRKLMNVFNKTVSSSALIYSLF